MGGFKDIITDETGDLSLQDGDILLGFSDSQHVEHIILADKGHYRQFPLIGVGLARYLNGNINPVALEQEISLNLESDNYSVKRVQIDPNDLAQIDIDAERKQAK